MQKTTLITRLQKPIRWFEHATLKKRITAIIIVGVILFMLPAFFGGNKSKYSFDTVQRGTITQLVTENGNVVSANETDVYSPTTGSLDHMYVKNSDYVHAGDKLFTVRSTATKQEQAAAYATYETAQSELTTAQNNQQTADATMWTKQQAYLTAQDNQNYKNNNTVNPATKNNYTDLEKQQIDSAVVQTQKDFEAAEQAYKTADVAIADAQAQVNSANLAYQATQNATVTAPVSGTVSNIVGLPGAKIVAQVSSAATANSTQNATSATTVLVIGNNNNYAIQTTVSEVDIDKISLGLPVTVLFSAVPNKTYNGNIIQADTDGTNNSGVITYNVFVSITNGDNRIKPNMTANLTIKATEHKNVLTVANSAIVPYQNGKAVQVLNKNGNITYIPVTIGLKGFTRSEVVKGVNAGTRVILGNTNPTNTNSGGLKI